MGGEELESGEGMAVMGNFVRAEKRGVGKDKGGC